jgi:hypothetical protein
LIVFENPGKANTQETIRIAVERAKEKGYAIVASTTSGESGSEIVRGAKALGYDKPIVIVTHAFGSMEAGKNALTDENRAILEAHSARIVTAAHTLSGAERGVSSRFQGVYPVEIIAQTLRMLSNGIKVTVEIGSMALDSGAIEHASPIIAIGGTGHGFDTAVVITPAHANKIFETKIHEILCMPY